MGRQGSETGGHGETGGPPRARVACTRALAALALAFVSLAAAVLGAVGPADTVRSTYSWPPRELPAGSPSQLWYTPLLLTRQEPESVSVRIPCALAPSLHGATEPTTVIATARDPEVAGGLAVSRSGDTLTVSVGAQGLGELATSARAGRSCAYRIQLADGSWSIDGGPDGASLSGDLDHMPVVFGLFSALDVRSDGAPTIDVTTAVHDTRTTTRQTIAWIMAVAALLAVLLLLAVPAPPRRPFARLGTGLLGAARQLHLADAVVVVVLAGWWIVAPVIWDDGWIVARERTFAGSGGFSTYYDVLGVNLPLDYWVEWLHHWVAERSSVVLDLRLHALLVLLTTWVLLRWAFGRVRGAPAGPWDAPVWALASAFLVVALAWDMTIRPEPVTALLATGVAACAIRFVARETVAPLAVVVLLVPLALTAHHTGIVALAPVLAVSSRLAQWVRHRWLTFAALLVGAASWGVVLLSVGSDAGQRLSDARTTSKLGITSPWRDELHRYVLVDSFPWATPLRRGSVALIALALLAFASRRRAGRLLDLPSTMLALALVLLVLTPSKLAWHFGSLAGLLALAIGSEVAGIREEGARARGRQARPYLVIGAAILASAWSWFPRDASNPVDLRSLAWDPGVDASLPFSKLAIALPVVVLGCALLVGVARRARSVTVRVPWRVAAWTMPMFAAPLILFTVAVLGRDLQRTDGWTLTRQNLDSIVGRSGCGLADEAVASLPGSARALSTVGGPLPPTPSWVPPAPVDGLPRFALSSSTPNTPWFRLPPDRKFGLFVAGSTVPGGQVALQWGRQDGKGSVDVVRTDTVGEIAPRIETSPWTFAAGSELPAPHPLADVVRIATTPSDVPRAPLAVTAPGVYGTERLSSLIGDRAASALIHPALLLYFLCARQPALADGAVEVPRYFVWFDNGFQPHPYESTSPFLGVHDLYPVQRLPLTDGTNPPAGVVVYEVERAIPGAKVLPPDVRRTVSGTTGSVS